MRRVRYTRLIAQSWQTPKPSASRCSQGYQFTPTFCQLHQTSSGSMARFRNRLPHCRVSHEALVSSMERRGLEADQFKPHNALGPKLSNMANESSITTRPKYLFGCDGSHFEMSILFWRLRGVCFISNAGKLVMHCTRGV